ncbi:MAG TPA: site-specific integrase, partial [Anaeromyxobacteraceae bacterium]|nr:site-specific integrase [Anaeromyxobacteraceae bacterium]
MGRAGAAAGPGGPLSPALDLFLAHLRVEKGLAPNSVESYARDVRRYVEWLGAAGRTSWDEVGRADVQGHLGALTASGISARSQARA